MRASRWQPNPDRLIWNNNGTYWMRWQPYDPQITERLTFNLKTKDIEEARRRRDALMANWNQEAA